VRLAGEQESALRALISRGLPGPRDAGLHEGRGHRREGRRDGGPEAAEEQPDAPVDLRTLLARHATGPRIALAEPGTPVELPGHAARELAAAVGAALDNVRAHAGEDARAWILLEDEPGQVIVTVRDDGPGIPAGRLQAAEQEGRLGVAQSIRGRVRDLGGTAELFSVPGQGAEVELRIPKA
jgi:signal transduction histidine kinase